MVPRNRRVEQDQRKRNPRGSLGHRGQDLAEVPLPWGRLPPVHHGAQMVHPPGQCVAESANFAPASMRAYAGALFSW